MVLTADYVRRVFVNTLLGEIDYNRYNRFTPGGRAPIIPQCTAAQVAARNPNDQCSNGSITFWTPGGRAVYNALLVRLDKRLTNRVQFTASYALTGQSGNNGIQGADNNVANLDNWFQSYGPQGSRHIFNVSGTVVMPLGFELGVISSIASRGPVMPYVTGVDLDGDGTVDGSTPVEAIPGVERFNCFNRGCGKSDLAAAVQAWNSTFAGKLDARGGTIPSLILPSSYEFGDSFSSQDIRLTKKFTWKDRYTLAVFGEMFNVFNIANLSGFNYTINSVGSDGSPAFGQPTQRAQQVFGSGGPRAMQVGARLSF
jgi:hypothetical protein